MPVRIENISAAVYTIPTDKPEADGTLEWDKTTIVVAFVGSGGKTGIGYTYAAGMIKRLIEGKFAELLTGMDVFDIPACWTAMRRAVRNLGLRGQVASAIAAVDTALWDLKARLLDIPLAALFGRAHTSVPVYGSGGFTTYGQKDITHQISGWKEQGITQVKIKIGAHPHNDVSRVEWARSSLEPQDQLFVDANGAYSGKQALLFAEAFSDYGVTWFEEPVSSDDLEGLHGLRWRSPPGMDITAGEYGYDLCYFRRMLEAGAVDVLQIDATRAQGYSGFIEAATLAAAFNIPVSSHCAPALHLPVCCHLPQMRHMEYFHDHVRIENMIFDGVPQVKNGELTPIEERGNGLVFKRLDAERYAA